jgi:hypothetical protein
LNITERRSNAINAGGNYAELSNMFDAAVTEDLKRLETYLRDESPAIRFASYINPLFQFSISDLSVDPINKFAAVFNPSTSTEVLDAIGINQVSLNPVLTEAIHAHKNASKEFQTFFTLAELGIKEDKYQNEWEKFFLEAIFDDNYECRNEIDLESLEALFYLFILGFIEAPYPETEFWEYFLDAEPKNLDENLELFGSLPPIPGSLYDQCHAVVGARSLAGAWTKNPNLMRRLAWDRQSVISGTGGLYWQDSRSPRSCIASNDAAPLDLLRAFFDNEKSLGNLNDYPQPIFWHLSFNPSSPEDVLSGIVSLIENGEIGDEFAQLSLLVGEPNDFPFGLITNRAVKGELRIRVEKLLRARNLDPNDYEVLE